MSNAINPVPARIFTREDPCTKVDLHNCFFRGGAYVRRPMVEARGDIGLNAIKYLKREELARVYEENNVDYWELTAAGKEHVRKGLARYLELHPEARADVVAMPSAASPVRRRRTR